jgi:hypothetical protein
MKVWAIETRGRSSEQIVELEKAENENWLIEVTNYRNFAHRCFLVSQGLFQVESRKLIFRSVIQARKSGPRPSIRDGLVEYRDAMSNLFAKIQNLQSDVNVVAHGSAK